MLEYKSDRKWYNTFVVALKIYKAYYVKIFIFIYWENIHLTCQPTSLYLTIYVMIFYY